MDIINMIKNIRNIQILLKNLPNYKEMKQKIENDEQNYIDLDSSDLNNDKNTEE